MSLIYFLILVSSAAFAVERPDPVNEYLPAESEVMPVLLPADECRSGYTCYDPPTSCDFTFTTESTVSAVETALNNVANGPVFCVPTSTDWSAFADYVEITRDCSPDRCVIIPSDFSSMTTNAAHRTSPQWAMISLSDTSANWAIIGQDITSPSDFHGIRNFGDNHYIAYNYIHDYGGTSGSNQGIALSGSTQDAVIYNNIIEDGCVIPSVDCAGINTGGADRTIIHRNTIRDWGGGDGVVISQDSNFDLAPDTRIIANSIEQTGAHYISCTTGTTPTGTGECACAENPFDLKTGNGIIAGNLISGIRRNRPECGGTGSGAAAPHHVYADGWTIRQNYVWDSINFFGGGTNHQYRGVGSSQFANVLELAGDFTDTSTQVVGWIPGMSGGPHQFSWNTVKCTDTTSNTYGARPYATHDNRKAITYNLFIGCDAPDGPTPEAGLSVFQNAYVDTAVSTDSGGETSPSVDDTASLASYGDLTFTAEICEHRSDPANCTTYTVTQAVPPKGGVLDSAVVNPSHPYGSGVPATKKIDGSADNTYGAVSAGGVVPLERLEIAPRLTYFQTETSKEPVFLFGENEFGILENLSKAEIDTLLEDRGTRYNVVTFMALHFADSAVSSNCTRSNYYGHTPFSVSSDIYQNVATPLTVPGLAANGDPNDWWDLVDYAVDKAAAEGLYVFILPMWAKHHVLETQACVSKGPFTTTTIRQFGHWLGQRYGGRTNVLWSICGDCDPTNSTLQSYNRAMVAGINEGAAGAAYNTGPAYNQASANGIDWSATTMVWHPNVANATGSAGTFGNDYWIDGHGMQAREIGLYGTVSGEATYGQTDTVFSGAGDGTYRALPTVLMEDNVRIDEAQDDEVRANPYQTVLAGGVSYFGLNRQIYYPEPSQPSLTTQPGFSSHVTYTYEQVAKTFFESFDWWNLIPDQTIITSGAGTYDTEAYKIAAYTNTLDRIVVFYGENSSGTINVGRLSGYANWDYIFFNPDDGTYGGSGNTSSSSVALTPPVGWEQAVLIVTPGSATVSGVDRPYSPEEYINDNLQWPSQVTHGQYQAKHEFPFYDSRVDTCDDTGTAGTDAWPYDPQLIPASTDDPQGGLSGCFDLVPTSWAPVSCVGASAVHPSLSNVYIVREQDRATGYANANSAAYDWVLACPGSLNSKITITASGTGLNAGEARVYDCLNADGTYTPMRPFSKRTGTADECHIRAVEITGQYVFFRSHYFESQQAMFLGQALQVNQSTSGWNVLDNIDIYGGGQTNPNSGYNSLNLARFNQSGYGWLQNFRFVDCVARYNDDDEGVFVHEWFEYSRVINGEIRNCAKSVFKGGNIDTTFWDGEGDAWENIWASIEPARYMNQIDVRYWDGKYGVARSKIPYGYIGGGQPPSYVKASAVSASDLDDAFECAADKTGSACPFVCAEGQAPSYKNGSVEGADPSIVRRVFVWGNRISRRDTNNPIDNAPSPPVQTYSQCGGSSGTQISAALNGQHSTYNIRGDLWVAEGLGPLVAVYSSPYTNTQNQIKIKNSLKYAPLESWMLNEYIDDTVWRGIIDNQESPTNNWADQTIRVWGSTITSEVEDWGSNKAWATSPIPAIVDCSAFINLANGAVASANFSGDLGAIFGSTVPHNGLINRSPSSGSYDESVLSDFCYITNPWSAIESSEATYRCIPNVVPQEQSPIEGLCTIAAPF